MRSIHKQKLHSVSAQWHRYLHHNDITRFRRTFDGPYVKIGRSMIITSRKLQITREIITAYITNSSGGNTSRKLQITGVIIKTYVTNLTKLCNVPFICRHYHGYIICVPLGISNNSSLSRNEVISFFVAILQFRLWSYL